ncbi:YagK/YfjJ domain-containing protein [Pseudomonas aeruginosa]
MRKTFLGTYKGLRVNSCPTRELAVYPPILDRIYNQLLSLQSYYSRIMIIRIDLHFPENHDIDHKLENTLIIRYLKLLKSDLGSSRWQSHKRFIHGWVKENGKTQRSHHHLFIGIQSLQRVLGLISDAGHTSLWGLLENRWKALSGGSVQLCGYHVVERENPSSLDGCLYHLSYLA